MEKIDSLGGALALMKSLRPNLLIGDDWSGVARVLTIDRESCLLMFKRQYYESFKYHFPNCTKTDGGCYGWAQVMNNDLLNKACLEDLEWIIFVTPDAKAYRCRPKLFRKFVDKYDTQVPHLKGEVAMPLDFFERIEKKGDVV